MIEYENLGKANRPYFKELQESFASTLESGRYVLGGNVERFEREFASYCGARHGVGVGSGLDAIMLSLLAFGFKPGSEVIVPSNAYIATVLAVVHAGLKPVPVEPDIRSYNIDPGKIESRLSPRTVAVVPVHLYGRVCEMDAIADVARVHGLKLIEDCAQAHGSAYRGRRAGSFGDCAAFSFYPTKNLGAFGDGGIVLTDDQELARRVRALGNYGATERHRHDVVGYNSRLDEIQAGFLSVKLRHLEEINRRKRELARIYHDTLKSEYTLPLDDQDHLDNRHIFAIRHSDRDKVRRHLASRGIGTAIHYPVPPHHQSSVREFLSGHDYPIAEEIHDTIFSLPISCAHTEEEIRTVAAMLNAL